LIRRGIRRCDAGTGNTVRPLLAVPVVQGNQAEHLVQGCLECQVDLGYQDDHRYHGFQVYQVGRVVLLVHCFQVGQVYLAILYFQLWLLYQVRQDGQDYLVCQPLQRFQVWKVLRCCLDDQEVLGCQVDRYYQMVLVVQEVQVDLEVQAGKLDIDPLGLAAVAQEFQADQFLLVCQAGLNLHLLLAGQDFPVRQEDSC